MTARAYTIPLKRFQKLFVVLHFVVDSHPKWRSNLSVYSRDDCGRVAATWCRRPVSGGPDVTSRPCEIKRRGTVAMRRSRAGRFVSRHFSRNSAPTPRRAQTRGFMSSRRLPPYSDASFRRHRRKNPATREIFGLTRILSGNVFVSIRFDFEFKRVSRPIQNGGGG